MPLLVVHAVSALIKLLLLLTIVKEGVFLAFSLQHATPQVQVLHATVSGLVCFIVPTVLQCVLEMVVVSRRPMLGTKWTHFPALLLHKELRDKSTALLFSTSPRPAAARPAPSTTGTATRVLDAEDV